VGFEVEILISFCIYNPVAGLMLQFPSSGEKQFLVRVTAGSIDRECLRMSPRPECRIVGGMLLSHREAKRRGEVQFAFPVGEAH
jgi:hypothetical protein